MQCTWKLTACVGISNFFLIDARNFFIFKQAYELNELTRVYFSSCLFLYLFIFLCFNKQVVAAIFMVVQLV